jgi:uncharacterized protein (TIGR03435 family)
MLAIRLAPVSIALWLGTALLAQTPPAAAPSFEVASIKPAPPLDPAKIMQGKMHIGMTIDAARVDIGSASLSDLVVIAYKIKPYQLTRPDWMASERFDVLAKMPEGAKKDDVGAMLQGMLADRFKMATHRETKDHPVYALIIGKNGPKLKEAPKEAATPAPAEPPADGAPPKQGVFTMDTPEGKMSVEPSGGRGGIVKGGPFGQMKFSVTENGTMRMEFASISMLGLADMLTRFTDRPVVDMTELKGNYEIVLDLSIDEMRNVMRAAAASAGLSMPMGGGEGREGRMASPADAASTPSGSSILTAIQQLGLKLDPRKAPIEMVVVDHMEKSPTEN